MSKKHLSKLESELVHNRRGTIRDAMSIVDILGLHKEINTGLETKAVVVQKRLDEV